MSELKLECKGSILLFSEDDTYCKQCPLFAECKIEVDRNRSTIQELMGRPVFKSETWQEMARTTQRRRAMAQSQSEPKPKPAPTAQKPAPVAPVASAPVAVATGIKRTPTEAMTLDGLQVKVRAQLERWHNKAVDPSGIERGENPFTSIPGMEFPTYFANAVLQLGVTTKRALMDQIAADQLAIKGESWSQGSLQSNVNILAGAFAACGYNVIQEKA